jgi:hypothetical protein
MAIRINRESLSLRLPDGSEIREFSITRDEGGGEVNWSVERRDGVTEHWVCRFSRVDMLARPISPEYTGEPYIAELSRGAFLVDL